MSENISDRIINAIGILKSITRIVKIVPFLYTFLYILFLVLQFIVNETALCIMENILYVSPIMILLFVLLSYKLKFCKWHRVECLLPITQQVLSLVDAYIYEFGEYSVYVIIYTIALLFTLSLVNAYFVFVRK